MKKPVFALGLDGADSILLENWMSQGHLKHLNRLRRQGVYLPLSNQENCLETAWTTFLTGCLPEQTGYWGKIKFQPNSYETSLVESYNFQEYPPFYDFVDRDRVAISDLSQISDSQIKEKSTTLFQAPSYSPSTLPLPQLIPQAQQKLAGEEKSGTWWDKAYLTNLKQVLLTNIERRAENCKKLLRQGQWDLLLTLFTETHSAVRDFWFLSQPDHPLYHHHRLDYGENILLEVFEAVDRAIAEILTEIPENVYVVVFAVNGSGKNNTDLASMLFLPEFLYRFSFPGEALLPASKPGTIPLPPVIAPQKTNWSAEIWRQIYHPNPFKRWLRRWGSEKINQNLEFLLGQQFKLGGSEPEPLSGSEPPKGTLTWQPSSWYKPFWSQMKAFALPSCSQGQIRINLQGRESLGIVRPSEYDSLCEQLSLYLSNLKNARTGELVVKEVMRMRQSAFEYDPKLPDADLVVIWQDKTADVMESPDWGSIGPVPYRCTGSYRPGGFLIATGVGIEVDSSRPESHIVNLAPTILKLMGVNIPEYFEGEPLI